jgi:hypothetical protein
LANCKGRCGAAGNGTGTTIKYLRRTTSGAAGNGLGTTIKYLRQATSGAAGNSLSTTILPLMKKTLHGNTSKSPPSTRRSHPNARTVVLLFVLPFTLLVVLTSSTSGD